MRTSEQQRDFVPTGPRRQGRRAAESDDDHQPYRRRPLAFVAANIFGAPPNGYIETRKVDIGDHVKGRAVCWPQITAPELDHQIAQGPRPHSARSQATLQQTQASRDISHRSPNDRDSPLVKKGWVTPQQGDTDRLTLQGPTGSNDWSPNRTSWLSRR